MAAHPYINSEFEPLIPTMSFLDVSGVGNSWRPMYPTGTIKALDGLSVYTVLDFIERTKRRQLDVAYMIRFETSSTDAVRKLGAVGRRAARQDMSTRDKPACLLIFPDGSDAVRAWLLMGGVVVPRFW